jgi:FtsP/CotA-like multicopper oxidase with cupredoxin domain
MSSAKKLFVAVTLAALVAGVAGCGNKSSGDTTTTTTVPKVQPISTTPEGGEAVEATFPTVQGLPLTEPPVITSTNGVLELTFDVKKGEYEVAGTKVKGMTFTGSFMGPTLLISPGDTLKFNLINNLDQKTNLHEHGLHVSPVGISDNVLRVMEPKSTNPIVVETQKDLAAGTYWYHTHLHGLTEAQVMAGLFGTLIVNGLSEKLPADLASGLKENLVALHDYQLDKNNAIITENIDSNAPTTRTVNGMVNPVMTSRPGQTQMLRLANFSADIWYKLEMGGTKFSVLAEDANPVGTVVAVSGGIIADLFMGHRPAILLPGKPYALAGLVGVLVYVLLANKFKVHTNLATAADVLVVVAIRIVVDWKGITTPTPAEITPGLLERMESRDGDDLDGRGTA